MPPLSSPTPSDFAVRIIAWQKRHGRHDLPWQRTRDPYRIWLSEIMLQQTQVSAVIPYFERFLARFPSLAALASAPLEAVLEAWAGLGYYARARNLHRCARQVMDQHAGRWPTNSADLRRLAGIGRSTAAAVAVFVHGERAAILDGNVKRVLARHAGIEGYPGHAFVEKRLWALAEDLLPATEVEAYTQGLMDLGATLCRRADPDCTVCPVAGDCVARRCGRQAELPTPKERRATPERSTVMVLVTDGDGVLLRRRPPSGIWGGLLAPPEGNPQQLMASIGLDDYRSSPLPALIHAFTHFRLIVEPVVCRVAMRPSALNDPAWEWIRLDQAESAALPSPIRRLLVAMTDASAGG